VLCGGGAGPETYARTPRGHSPAHAPAARAQRLGPGQWHTHTKSRPHLQDQRLDSERSGALKASRLRGFEGTGRAEDFKGTGGGVRSCALS